MMQSGLASSTLANALTRRWPKGERLIAQALGVAPEKHVIADVPPAQPGYGSCAAFRLFDPP